MRLRYVLILSWLSLSSACDTGQSASLWTGQVDTLASGVIHVISPDMPLWDSASTWRAEETLRIGASSGDGEDLFGQIRAIEVDASGRIHVLEPQAREVRVFTADGEFVRTLGRPGEGPGEFRLPAGLAWDPDGNLWVADPGNGRFSVFDSAGEYRSTVRHPQPSIILPWRGTIDRAGRVYDYTFASEGYQIVRFAVSGDSAHSVETYAVPPHEPAELIIRDERGQLRASMTVPFTPDRAMHLDHDGHLWWGITGNYRLVQQSVAGDSVRIIERAYEPLPVQEVEAQNALEATANIGQPGWSVDGPPVPDFKPAFRSFFLDDSGYLWVYPHLAPEDDGRVFEIFDPVGRFLGRVHLPFVVDMSIMPVVRGGSLYAVTRDEFDVQYVTRVRITGAEMETASSVGHS